MPEGVAGAASLQSIGATPAELPALRAAYSDRTAALMAHLAAFAYDSSLEAGPAPAVPEKLALLGFTSFWPFHSGLTDGWAYIAQCPDLIVLSFRGTKSVKNWATNFHVGLARPEGTPEELRVHEGFYRAFKMLADGEAGLSRKLGEIKREAGSTVPVYITGHSLGGALAQIASAVLGDDQVAACYTFGSPRVGNSHFDLWVKVPSYRIVNHADIVPQVPLRLPPFFPYRHSGDPRYLPEPVSGSAFRYEPGSLARLWQLAQGVAQWLKARSILGVADHAIREYSRKLDSIAAKRTQRR
ncbi:MAG TPA: lipase family protein [Methylocella sp.]|nr:lipase family protein [Methylocella sp.]